MAKKKWKKRLKKIAKAALIGGALYAGSKLLKGARSKARSKAVAGTDDAGLGVTHSALQGPYITKKDKTAIIKKKPVIQGTDWGNVKWAHGAGAKKGMHERIADQKYETGEHYIPDLKSFTPQVHSYKGINRAKGGRVAAKKGGRIGKQFGGALPVGGTARRDMRSGYYPSDMGMRGGQMYKKGGRVTGIAKRGFGRALMKGKK